MKMREDAQREEKQRELQEIRRMTGMNRKEFALEYDIPYQTITDWELGHRRVPKYFLRLLRYKVLLEESRRFDAVSEAQTAGMKEVRRQMSLDYCCSLKDLEEGSGNLFTEYYPAEGRRRVNEREEKFLHRALFIVRCGVDSVDSNAVFHALHLLLSAPRHDKRGHFLWYSSVPPDAWEGYQIAGRM